MSLREPPQHPPRGGADTASAAGAKLGDVAFGLAAAIDTAQAAGRDVTKAKADLDAMKAQIASGVAAAGSVPGPVLGLTPADWNARAAAGGAGDGPEATGGNPVEHLGQALEIRGIAHPASP